MRIFYRLALTLTIGWTALVGAVRLVAGSTTPRLSAIDLPSRYLPGSPLPEEAHCTEPLGGQPCYAHYYDVDADGQVVHLTYDLGSGRITGTVMAAHLYTIGDLITAWGMPSSFAQYGRAIDVYWGTRYAYLAPCSFRPDSRVELIAYYREPCPASAWRGFTSGQGYEC